jgi:uncharacterized membrane protein
MIQQPFALLAFMFFVVASARALEQRFEWVRKISSAVVCTLLGIALANAGLIPKTSAVHEGIYDIAVPFTIVLVILASRLSDLRRAGWRMVVCFGLAAAGSFAGAFGASLLYHRLLGPETWKMAGAFAGAFAGGGMNFAAVGRGLQMSPDLFAAAFVADNLSTVPYLLAQVGLFTLLAPYYRKLPETAPASPSTEGPSSYEDPRRYWTSAEISITDLALLSALPLGALYLSRRLSPLLPGFPEVLWLTTLALIAAQVPWMRKLKGAAVLSYFSLHLFFIVIGANSDIHEVIKAGFSVFAYMLTIIAIHAVTVYGFGRLLDADLPTISIASQAAVGGPGSAMALAMAMKWNSLVTPGIIVGIFGYAIGNYLGFACSYTLRGLL